MQWRGTKLKAVGALGVLEAFASVMGKSVLGAGNMINATAFTLEVLDAKDQLSRTGRVEDASLQSIASAMSGFGPLAASGALTFGVISAPVAAAVAVIGVLGAAAFSVLALSQEKGSSDISDAVEGIIAEAQELAGAVGDAFDDIIGIFDNLATSEVSIDFSQPFPEWVKLYDSLFGEESVSTEVYDFFQLAFNWVQRRDPLILDLDGDGMETIGRWFSSVWLCRKPVR